MKGKNKYWQSVRGICILAVIAIHCPNAINFEGIEQDVWLFLREIFNYPVAIFIFMDGYFTNIDKVSLDTKGYILGRVKRLFIPYIFWSLLYSIINIIIEERSIKSIVIALIIGKAATPFYYIIVLMQLTFITPMLINIIKSHLHIQKILWLLSPLYLLYLYVWNYIEKSQPPLYATLFPAWFIFYFWGLNVKYRYSIQFPNKRASIKFIYVMGAFLFQFIETLGLLKLGYDINFAISQIRLGGFAYSMMIIMYLLSHDTKTVSNKILSCMSYLGDKSYSLFYLHCLVILFWETMIDMCNINYGWLIQFTICFIGTIICSLMLIVLEERLRTYINKRKCRVI